MKLWVWERINISLSQMRPATDEKSTHYTTLFYTLFKFYTRRQINIYLCIHVYLCVCMYVCMYSGISIRRVWKRLYSFEHSCRDHGNPSDVLCPFRLLHLSSSLTVYLSLYILPQLDFCTKKKKREKKKKKFLSPANFYSQVSASLESRLNIVGI